MHEESAYHEKGTAPMQTETDGKPRTGRDLLEALEANGLVGMWQDRTDIADSTGFARKLRERAQTR